jgi:hypothetical protein
VAEDDIVAELFDDDVVSPLDARSDRPTAGAPHRLSHAVSQSEAVACTASLADSVHRGEPSPV